MFTGMSTILSVPQFVAPLWVIMKRLDLHSRPGGMLAGLHWSREGILRVASVNKLPSLQPYFAEYDGAHGEGATRPGTGRNNSTVRDTITFKIELSSDVKDGFVRADPERSGSKPGHYEWAGLIMDAIETDETGTTDATLERSVSEPILFALREPEPSELSFSTIIEITLKSQFYVRAQRGYTFPNRSA
jgi:hypothetical protein